MPYKDSMLEVEDERIRPVVWVFSAFEMAMLFQTDYYHLGTIVSAILCGLIVLTYLLESNSIEMDRESAIIFTYMLILVGSTFFTTNITSKLIQFIIYVILYIFLSSLNLRDKEVNLIINVFVFASFIYAILIIYSRFIHSTDYIHSSIVLFGTNLDPNYVGLPLVVTFSFLLYDFLNDKKSLVRLFALFIIAMAILLTSSRGNFLSLSVCIIANFIFFLKNRNGGFLRKVLVLLICVLGLGLFYRFASNNYGSYLERMLSFSSEGDISNGRYELWGQAIQLWTEYPLFGNGFESLGRRVDLGVHNTYIQLLCDSGIIGFTLFISFLCMLIKKSCNHDIRIFIGLIGLACHCFFLGEIATRCFWVVLIMASLVLNSGQCVSTDT